MNYKTSAKSKKSKKPRKMQFFHLAKKHNPLVFKEHERLIGDIFRTYALAGLEKHSDDLNSYFVFSDAFKVLKFWKWKASDGVACNEEDEVIVK